MLSVKIIAQNDPIDAQVKNLPPDLQADVKNISSITILPSLLEVICNTTGMGFAAVARVTENKWIVCSVLDKIDFGLEPGGELKLETTICHEIRQSGDGVIIDHVELDETFLSHHTPAMYGFQSYISMPITRKDGTFFGTLCAIDPKPAKLNRPEIINMFKLFADLISFHLNSIEQLSLASETLLEEKRTADLREQFIAILGHDMRNPAGAALSIAQLLLNISQDTQVRELANILQSSSYRMMGLIDNIMDFASGRLGGGIVLDLKNNEDLEKVITHAISEIKLIWPNRVIDTTITLTQPVKCDGKRIAQLLSNLLSNALLHGKEDTAVRIKAISTDGQFSLSVANQGTRINEATMKRLFHPFARGEIKHDQGLGLGLYIASEIAAAHKGKLVVSSSDQETVFTLDIPNGQRY